VKPELIARHYVPQPLPGIVNILPQQTMPEALADLQDAFSVLDAWDDRYQYIIDMGIALQKLPQEYCTEAHRLHGCQSQVWLVMQPHDGKLYMHAVSDAVIVNGLIALMSKIYSGRTPVEILSQQPDFIASLGLGEHLSPTRKNGLFAMAEAIHNVAAHAQTMHPPSPDGLRRTGEAA
jgi:cysteine desulfuration protein SufE